MNNYLVTYHAPAEAMHQMSKATPEEKQAGMAPWMAWKAKVESAIVDFGAPLSPGQNLDKAGRWSNSSKEITGYSIVQAEDYSAAQALLKDHPHLYWSEGCSIELHETISM